MKQFLTQAVLVLVLAVAATAQTRYITATQFMTPAKSAVPGLASNAASARAFDYSAADAARMFMGPEKAMVVSNFPIGLSEQGTLDLRETTSPFGLETHAWKIVSGKKVEIPLPSSRAFKGSVRGESGSKVLVVVTGGDMYATVERSSGTMMQIAPSTTKENTVLLLDNSHAPAPSFSCGLQDMPDAAAQSNLMRIAENDDSKKVLASDSTALLECKVAVETDRFLWVKMGKDETKIIKYLYTIFATVSWIYERETNVCFVLGDLFIHDNVDNPDVYTQNAKGDVGALLGEFTSNWQTSYTSVKRNVAVLYTVPGVTDVGGIAWLGSLCKSNGFAACGIRTTSALPTQNYQWDAFVTAHEIGHTFSAPHTHNCFWAPLIDTCVTTTGNPPIADACTNGKAVKNAGSIMSYCHLIIGENPGPRYTFLPRVAAQVRAGAWAKGTCLVPPAKATIKLTQPIGGIDQTVRADTGVVVEWASVKVSTVNLEYSLDSGKTFTAIAAAVNLPASDRRYRWFPPSGVGSNKAMIRIYDPSAPSVSDTSFTSFKLGAPALKLLNWVGGERIGRKSTEVLQWERTFLTTNNVEFSATGDEPWTVLSTETNSTQFSWKVPDIETNKARLRLVSGSVLTVSEPFSIGTPVLNLITPAAGDSACSGYVLPVRWESDFVRQIEIRYSRNNGTSFPPNQIITTAADAKSGSVKWTVPANKTTDSAMVRLLCTNDTGVYVYSKRFIISNCLHDGVHESSEMNGIRIARMFPAPANAYLQMEVENGRSLPSAADIQVVANDGRVVLRQSQILELGSQVVKLNMVDLPSGSYIVVMRLEGAELSLPFVVAH